MVCKFLILSNYNGTETRIMYIKTKRCCYEQLCTDENNVLMSCRKD